MYVAELYTVRVWVEEGRSPNVFKHCELKSSCLLTVGLGEKLED